VVVLCWDASALAKRHLPEVGTDAVNALFAVIPSAPMAITILGYVETAAVLRRKFNQGIITTTEFQDARTKLEVEVFSSPGFDLLSMTDADLLGGLTFIDQYNLNASDAAILALYLRYAAAQPPGAPTCVLVAADQRLLQAVALEGLATLNPETVLAADVPALLATF
jgi:uncharacterized protein